MIGKNHGKIVKDTVITKKDYGSNGTTSTWLLPSAQNRECSWLSLVGIIQEE
jgi:hypothetical protein